MPAYRVPRRSGPHRVAAIALFRALLSQARLLQLQHPQRDELQNLIRNRFKQARRDQSARRLKVSFEAGYEAVDLLDDAVTGSEESKSKILKLLENAPLKARQAPTTQQIPDKKNERHMKDKCHEKDNAEPSVAAEKPRISLFDRPLPLSQLSGKRHVPVLVSANQIPMLRLKKPQPPHLSGYIVHRLKKRQTRQDRKLRLVEELDLAEREDDWDDLIDELYETVQKNDVKGAMLSNEVDEPEWSEVPEAGLRYVNRQLSEERRQNRKMAEKMQAVVDRETALAQQEKAERKAAWQKGRQLEAQDGGGGGQAGVEKPVEQAPNVLSNAEDGKTTYSPLVH